MLVRNWYVFAETIFMSFTEGKSYTQIIIDDTVVGRYKLLIIKMSVATQEG